MDEVRERGPLRAKDFFRVLNYNLQLTDNRNERFVSIVDSVRGSMYTMRTRGRRKKKERSAGEWRKQPTPAIVRWIVRFRGSRFLESADVATISRGGRP